MIPTKPAMSASFLALAISLLLLYLTQTQSAGDESQCPPSSCGNIHNITFPFRLRGDPENCGSKSYELVCEHNLTVLNLYSGKYYVQAINYNNYTIRLVDVGIQKDNCSSLPLHSFTRANFSNYYNDTYIWFKYKWTWPDYDRRLAETIIFLDCPNPMNSSFYLDTSPCFNFSSDPKRQSYVLFGHTDSSNVENSCSVQIMAMTSSATKDHKNISYMDIHSKLAYGFELSWFQAYCGNCSELTPCYVDESDTLQCYGYGGSPRRRKEGIFSKVFNAIQANIFLELIALGAYVTGKFILGGPCVMAFLIYKWRKRHLSMYDTVEEFLQSHNNFMPIRYTYSEIKKMSNGFKDKLGEGGYGSVYKGKLRSGHLVAIKMLGKSKANGQEFINEVATIGRIHHVNVVQLIGYCAEGSKRALVYEFMPNGSLDKYTSGREGYTALSWEKIYEISVRVARGIEYLHRGCDMQILHFDIKPHNILLDENFIAKVSDFGLAKLYPTNDTTVTVTAARGTIGYIAPELFYKNIGGVSYKADVYSFGMLLMEMAGKRRNLNPVAENSSEAYFPSCVYDQVIKGKDVDDQVGDATEEEKRIIKKMTIVALWCIQMKPSDRPSMSKVVEMLEGELENLPVPPKPVLFPEETLTRRVTDSSWTSSTSDYEETVSLIADGR